MIYGIVASVALIVAVVGWREMTRQRWRKVAHELGVELQPTFSVDHPHLTGTRLLPRPEWAERVAPMLEQLLWNDSNPLRQAAVSALGRLRWQPAVPSLIELVPTADVRLAEVITKALGSIGRGPVPPNPLFDDEKPLDAPTFVERSESYLTGREAAREQVLQPLLELLDHPKTRVVVAAAEALGSIGSAAAVERLQSVADSRGAAGRAAAEAVRQIQRRLPAAEDGQLSLEATGGTEGGLSPTEQPDAGGLSVECEENHSS